MAKQDDGSDDGQGEEVSAAELKKLIGDNSELRKQVGEQGKVLTELKSLLTNRRIERGDSDGDKGDGSGKGKAGTEETPKGSGAGRGGIIWPWDIFRRKKEGSV
jgi:hypothetical protein